MFAESVVTFLYFLLQFLILLTLLLSVLSFFPVLPFPVFIVNFFRIFWIFYFRLSGWKLVTLASLGGEDEIEGASSLSPLSVSFLLSVGPDFSSCWLDLLEKNRGEAGKLGLVFGALVWSCDSVSDGFSQNGEFSGDLRPVVGLVGVSSDSVGAEDEVDNKIKKA